jgi:nickel/cobalt transporter (NicO) family protein
MRALRFVRLIVRVVCAMALMGGGHAYADVFGRPDSPIARHAQTDEHPLLLPGFVRDAVRVVIVAQARLDEAMQDDVLSLRSLGTGVGTGGDDAGDPNATRDAWAKLIAFVGLCLAYGVLHALAPGHGKTIAAMYFGSRAASAKQVAGFTLATALGQSLTAIVLVSAALAIFEGTANAIMRTAAPLELVSAIAVLGVATLTAVRILRRQECCAPVPLFNAGADQGGTAVNTSDANANTDRAAYLGAKLAAQRRARPSFAAALDVAQPRRAGWLAFAVALRPCAGALFILLITARYHAYWLGIVAALAIGLGVAATVFTLGYALRSGRAITLKWATGPRLERWQRGVALAGALVIAVFSALQIVLIVTGVSTMTPS